MSAENEGAWKEVLKRDYESTRGRECENEEAAV